MKHRGKPRVFKTCTFAQRFAFLNFIKEKIILVRGIFNLNHSAFADLNFTKYDLNFTKYDLNFC